MMKKECNNHVKRYLKEYIYMKEPGFAVMINGRWGCGKTYFIKKFMSEYDKDFEDFDEYYKSCFLYISLYGVTKEEDIDRKIFLALHPKLNGKYTDLFLHFGKGIMSLTKTDGLLSEFQSKDFIHAIKGKNEDQDKIIVFDDFERCELSPNKILSYINSFVEHEKLKSIILAHEKEVSKGEKELTSEAKRTPYDKIFEKLVGRKFSLLPNIDGMLSSYFKNKDQSIPETNKLLEKHKDIIIEMFYASKTNNLRILKNTLNEFSRVFRYTDEKYISNDLLVGELVKWYFALSFEINSGNIKVDELGKLEYSVHASLYDKEENKGEDKYKNIKNKFPFFKTSMPLISFHNWKVIFEEGFIEKETLNECFENSRYYTEEKRESWVKLLYHKDLEDEEFDKYLNEVREKWTKREYTDPGIILHICGLMMFLDRKKLLKSKDSVLLNHKNYIDNVMLDEKIEERGYHNINRGDYAGLTFYEKDSTKFIEIQKHMINRIEELKEKSLPQKAKELLETMVRDRMLFRRQITLSNSNDQIYFNVPIFAHTTPSNFVEKLLEIPNRGYDTISYAFKERYEFESNYEKLISELKFLQGLVDIIAEKIKEENRTVSRLNLDILKNIYIIPAIEKLTTFRNK